MGLLRLLDRLFSDPFGPQTGLNLEPRPYTGPPDRCDRCSSSDITLDPSFDVDGIRTENYMCNNCGYSGGQSVA